MRVKRFGYFGCCFTSSSTGLYCPAKLGMKLIMLCFKS
jgi:hypothetical protein